VTPSDARSVDRSVDRAEAILRTALGERVRRGVVLAPLTTFRIGGPAALYVEPDRDTDLAAVGEAVAQTRLPFLVIGKGSNLLIADGGFAGIVVRLGRGYRWAEAHGDDLRAGAAMPLPALSGVALSHGLSGLEFGVAIPGSFGGALRMNAGAHGKEMKDAVASVEVFRLSTRAGESIPVDGAGFRYRGSDLPADAVIVGGTLRLVPTERDEIRRLMDEARGWRRRTQPLAEPNCGSVFKNPPGEHAARLVEGAGLKGFAIGGAMVSTKHANFIVAAPGATAADVMALVQHVQDVVEADRGIRLEAEVHVVGDLDPATR
jgi:UDP-N-acetylmuramate dehydrogenase